jgi:hypothetical protein
MKTRILTITILIAALGFSGCKKTLDLNPLDKIPASTFWKSKSDFDKGLAAVYASLQPKSFLTV